MVPPSRAGVRPAGLSESAGSPEPAALPAPAGRYPPAGPSEPAESSGPPEPAGAPPLESTPVTRLRGVGPGLAAKLAALGVETVLDLLFHLPSRYEDRTRVREIGSLRPGEAGLVCGRIDAARVRHGQRRSLTVTVADATGTMAMRLFHFNDGQRRSLREGRRIACYGEVRSRSHGLEMTHPEYRLLD